MSQNMLYLLTLYLITLALYTAGDVAGEDGVIPFSVPPKKSSTQSMLHLHIPKAGGTALTRYLRNNWIRQRCQWAKLLDTSFANISYATPRNSIIVSDQTAPCYWMSIDNGPKGHQGRQTLPYMVLNHGVKLQYGTGHLPFGYCQFIQSPCEYTTVFREPRDRLMSQYYYIQEKHSSMLKTCEKCQTFEGFVDAVLNEEASFLGADNSQTRMLCGASFFEVSGQKLTEGRTCGDIPFGKLNNTHLEIAKENIARKFPVVGLLGDLDMYQAMMLLEYGYLPYTVQTVRKTTIRKSEVNELDLSTRGKIDQLLEWDLQLWDFVQELVSQRVSQEANVVSALEYVRNFDAKLPNVDFLRMWDKTKEVSGDQAPGLVSHTSKFK